MPRQSAWLLWAGCLLFLFAPAAAQEPAAEDVEHMARRIDGLIEQRLRAEGIEPGPSAGDAEFLRRASLDLNGVIPTSAEVLEFLADHRPDKRRRAIDRLLANPRYATQMANAWSRMLLPPDAITDRFEQAAGFTRWLRRRFAENIHYDNIVADLLTTTGGGDRGGAALFYTAAGLKPEELAASTSRIFLGVQIHCAQCHDHPFEHWKQQDFWSYAAFFARLQQVPQNGNVNVVQLSDATSGEVTLPDTATVVLPKYLGAEPPPEDADVNRRRQLAIWMVSRDNPYFARVAVNRVWALLFGRGIVHPVDDFGPHNPPSHPELLDELTRYFLESGYDIKELLRVLTATRAYQRSSDSLAEGDEPAPELFARMQIKTLTPEQLFDCLLRATLMSGLPSGAAAPNEQQLIQARQQFVLRFNMGRHEATEFQAGIPQVLDLMNGALTAAGVDPEQGGLLTAISAPFFSNEERVEAVFLAALSRPLRDSERSQVIEYVKGGGPRGDPRQALGDVLWAVLNSPEFILNH